MSRLNLLLLPIFVVGLLGSAGCSIAVKNELDTKPPVPVDACETNADCEGAYVVCQLENDGLDNYYGCSCARGYEIDPATGECTFVGIVNAPGFDDATAWNRLGDVGIDVGASGNGDPGVATITSTGLCEGGAVSQTVAISAGTDSVPLVLEVIHRTTSTDIHHGGGQVPIGIGLDGAWMVLEGSDSWTTNRVCVGPRGLGGDVDLTATALYQGTDCEHGTTLQLEISKVDIVEADPGECPAIGTALNGDFEGSGGWDEYMVSGDAMAGIEAMIGLDGSAGLRLSTGPGGGYTGAVGPVIFPEDTLDGPYALQFWYRGTGSQLEVRLGQYAIADLPPSPLGQIATVCVPPFARGTGQPLIFTTLPEYTNGVNFAIDDIQTVVRPECADNDTVLDGSLELAASPLIRSPYKSLVNGGSYGTLSYGAVVDPAHAHTGVSSYRFSSSTRCDTLYAYDSPHFIAGGWNPGEFSSPAISFYYFVQNLSDFQLRATLDGPSDYLPEMPGWNQHVICLSADDGGKPVDLGFEFTNQTGGACADVLPLQTVYVDDIQVIDDPVNCP